MRDYSSLPNSGPGLCDRPVDKGYMTFPCRLPKEHTATDEPCLAPEVDRSVRMHQRWEETQREKDQSGTIVVGHDHIHFDSGQPSDPTPEETRAAKDRLVSVVTEVMRDAASTHRSMSVIDLAEAVVDAIWDEMGT